MLIRILILSFSNPIILNFVYFISELVFMRNNVGFKEEILKNKKKTPDAVKIHH